MNLVLATVAGALAWSLAEHLIHNLIGHKTRGRTEFSREHLAHHRDTTYFAASWKKAAMAVPVIAPLAGVGWWLVGGPGLGFAVGFTVAYVAYEIVHRRIHTHGPLSAYGRFLRRHHLHHHYRDANSNHGVTSALWDRVFRTFQDASLVKVPRKQAPPWLMDEAGNLRGDYDRDFVLVGPMPRKQEEHAA